MSGDLVLVAAHVLPASALSSIMSSAVVRSAVPLASVKRASTMSPSRILRQQMPMWQSLASLPAPLRTAWRRGRWSRNACRSCVSRRGSRARRCVRRRLSRRRLAAVLRHKTLHAGPGLDQRAVDREVLAGKKLRARGGFSTLAMNLAAMSPSSSRSRFFQNTVASHTGSSADSPTNQRNNKL